MFTHLEIRKLFLNGTDLSWYQTETVQPVLHHLQPVQHFLYTSIHSAINNIFTVQIEHTKNTQMHGAMYVGFCAVSDPESTRYN